MAEYRPEPRQLWQDVRRHHELARRVVLAVGGMLLAFGLTRALGGGVYYAASSTIGAGLLGFFASPFTG